MIEAPDVARAAEGAVAPQPERLTWALCVATVGRPELLARCVRAALAQTVPPAEIVIVDGSEPEAREASEATVARLAQGVRLTYLAARKRSLPAQRNQGIAAARADILFMIDDDAAMHRDCAEQILRVYEADAAGAIAAVGARSAPGTPDGAPVPAPAKRGAMSKARVVGAILRRSRAARFLWTELLMMSAERVFVGYDDEASRPMPPPLPALPDGAVKEVPFVSGYALTVRRAVALREPFDDALLAYAAAEDLDACYRFRRHGRIVVARNARLHHHEAAAGRLKRRQSTELSLVNVAYFVRRQGAHPAARRRFATMAGRRLVAEVLKDAAARRFDFPQARGILSGLREARAVLAYAGDDLPGWYEGVQRRVLSR